MAIVKKTKKKSEKTTESVKEDASLNKTKEMETVKADSAAKPATHKAVKQVKVKKNRKLGFNWFFWTSFIVLLIPCIYFVYLLMQAQQETNVPIIGNRIKNSVESEIPAQNVAAIESKVKALDGVEKATVNLKVETLRITVDVRDDMTAEQIEEMNMTIYGIINEELPIDVYFTQHYDYKQYDLEITSYNYLEGEGRIIIVTNKNSLMEEPRNQVLTVAVNQEVADEIRNSSEEELNKDKNDGDISDAPGAEGSEDADDGGNE